MSILMMMTMEGKKGRKGKNGGQLEGKKRMEGKNQKKKEQKRKEKKEGHVEVRKESGMFSFLKHDKISSFS